MVCEQGIHEYAPPPIFVLTTPLYQWIQVLLDDIEVLSLNIRVHMAIEITRFCEHPAWGSSAPCSQITQKYFRQELNQHKIKTSEVQYSTRVTSSLQVIQNTSQLRNAVLQMAMPDDHLHL
jgi:hypothetical protein